MDEIEIVRSWIKSPTAWIKSMYDLEPQPLRDGYVVGINTRLQDIKAGWFKPFEKGKHLTWQQWVILLAVERAANGIGPNFISVSAGRGIGKAISNDSLIPLANGKWKKMGDLEIGEEVIGSDGKGTKVTGVYPQGRRRLYRMEFSNGVEVKADIEHRWLVKKRSDRGEEVLTTGELIKYLKIVDKTNSKHDRKVISKPSIQYTKPVEYEKKKLSIHPYVLGVLIGDGCLRRGAVYSKPETDIAEKIRDLGYNVSDNRDGETHGILGVSMELEQTGLRGSYSHNKFIPHDYLYSSIDDRIAILQGLCDTDGHVVNGHTVEYSTASKRLAEEITLLVRGLGGSAVNSVREEPVYTYGGKKCVGRRSYRIWIQFYNGIIPVSSKKHLKKFTGKCQRQRIYIKKITSSKIEEATCITVAASDHLFLCNDYLVTHNSSVTALVLLWYLFTHKDAQIPCTAPSAQHMYDVLWKEVAKWHAKLPKNFRDKIDVESSYIRMKESPLTWYARAGTARKEKPEALAGVHSDHVLLIADEASAVADEVFDVGVGSLTNSRPVMLLISNYTRTTGYFHKSQENSHGEFEALQFSAVESPVVDMESVNRQKRYGEDSTEYRVNVLGLPPKSGIEIKGYVPLLKKEDLRFTGMDELTQPIIMGVDPSGHGRNKTAIVLRDYFRAVKVGLWLDLTPRQIAEKVCDISEAFKVQPENIILDSFGVGANVLQEFMILRKYVQGVLVGDPASDPKRFINIKAEIAWRLREWILKGGELSGTYDTWKELLGIRYDSEINKIKIMGKKQMAENGLHSPDLYDALALTFLREEYSYKEEKEEHEPDDFDIYGGI